MKTISIVVPVYKVEAYLDRCVQSIVDQTYRNLEIILVDDGSPDNCGAMCDAWAKKDSRIKVIHKENGGLSDARNAGMAAASGELMGFVDSDDFIHPHMYQLLLERMELDGSDMAVCGTRMVFEDSTPERPLTQSGNCLLSRKDALTACIEETWLKQTVWNRLYKSALVKDLPFPVGKYHEDVFWSWQAVARAQKVSVFDTPCYFYTQRSGSIMGQGYSPKRLDGIEAKCLRQEYLENHESSLIAFGRQDLLFSCLHHGQQIQKWLKDEEKNRTMAQLRHIVKACPLPDKAHRKTMRLSHRYWLAMAKWSLPIACKIRNVLKIGI